MREFAARLSEIGQAMASIKYLGSHGTELDQDAQGKKNVGCLHDQPSTKLSPF